MIKESDDEIWKEIDGFEELYAVSTKGNVKNIKTGRILIGWYNNDGYRMITLKGKTYYAHRLVALAFLDNPNNLPQVDHRDEKKDNNDISNLRWVTASQNQRHSAHNKSCKIKQLTKDGNLIRIWDSSMQIERELGYNNGAIINVLKGRQNYAFGFQWQYVNPNSQRIMNRPVVVYKGSEQIGEFASAVKASEALGLKYCSVNDCLKGRKATNKGYTFKYLE